MVDNENQMQGGYPVAQAGAAPGEQAGLANIPINQAGPADMPPNALAGNLIAIPTDQALAHIQQVQQAIPMIKSLFGLPRFIGTL
ncbi:unnamed protein product [Rhizoctonia solani]|uniref:Uncharacterized protein n=1 Tax=Rhizoctonia solani TaxID=456999 RepID=A0A8H3AD33_9AGAM|nr:unnamed protein product [Rhizoctonia solani]